MWDCERFLRFPVGALAVRRCLFCRFRTSVGLSRSSRSFFSSGVLREVLTVAREFVNVSAGCQRGGLFHHYVEIVSADTTRERETLLCRRRVFLP